MPAHRTLPPRSGIGLGTLSAIVVAWLGWPAVWWASVIPHQRPDDVLWGYVAYLLVGAPLVLPVSVVAYALAGVCVRFGWATRRTAVGGGAAVGVLVAVIARLLTVEWDWFQLSAVPVGALAGLAWWAALPDTTRAALVGEPRTPDLETDAAPAVTPG